ncbi:GpE family phage tail protein [Escherichia coli]
MADLAVVFHWPPSEMLEMDITDLNYWRQLAADRMPKKGAGNG